jgi:hypothetical protein
MAIQLDHVIVPSHDPVEGAKFLAGLLDVPWEESRGKRMTLADSLTYTHSSGVHDSKGQFLASLTMGQLSYKSIIPEARSVRVYGGAGIVTGTARMEITAHGQDTRFRIRYLAVYVKAQDRWQLVAWQSTRVPEA